MHYLKYTRLGDCMELVKGLEDKSVDLVLNSLPYGMSEHKWDEPIPLDLYWKEMNRVCKGACILTGIQPFTTTLINSNPDQFSHNHVWVRSDVQPGQIIEKHKPFLNHVDILVFKIGEYQYTGAPQSVIHCGSDAGGLHPVQKPVGLMERLIESYSKEGDTVLDMTMGSGTVGVAAHKLNRHFIGFERDYKFYKRAFSRLEGI